MFEKKSIQLLQNYSLISLSRPVDQNVYKIADQSASILNLLIPSPFKQSAKAIHMITHV